MKPTMALKPLVFALAAVMAMAAQADGRGGNNGHGNGHGQPRGPSLEQLLQITAGAGAAVLDAQDSDGNVVKNQGTLNNANASDSLNSSNGNMGANVAAGDGNQQDNAAALATADESFIFGNAVAASSATQVNNNNYVKNSSTFNNATLNNAGNNGSGNIGINVTSGNFNQQKNNLAIAVSGGRVAQAAASANQSSTGLVVENKGVQAYKTDTLTGTYAAAGVFKAKGTATIEDDNHGGWGNRGGGHGGNDDQKAKFEAVGTFGLAGVTTQQVLTKDGWKTPVVNNANMTGSMNNFSGNGGANVSAGVGNQQSNSLSIAAGCKACM
ncbi:heme utilization protein [Pseudomonas sp. SWRI153]|uniref:Heme utilization protein n=1 Tax=Pseudomonas khorasanensis TaxID=2745508 RepID=A0A923JD59_9PSED|nr:heme utilization protein [Pseudomonas khorasanensis]MBV4484891.1 heme utilization protein [Pseudomonas khorasanensis]